MTTTPTWGYKPDGSAQIFELKEGEKLPAGWETTPKPWNHPNSKHLHSRPTESTTPPPDGIPDQSPPKYELDRLENEAVEEEPKKRGPGRPRSDHSGL